MVSDLAVGGMSVLWSTAYMDEAERCAHVLMLDQGRLVYEGPPAGFTARVAGRVFAFSPPPGEARRMLARWQQEPDVRDALIQGSRIRVVLQDAHDGAFTRGGVELRPAEPRLEDAYIDAVGGMDPASFAVFAGSRGGPRLSSLLRAGTGRRREGRGAFSLSIRLSGIFFLHPLPRGVPIFPASSGNALRTASPLVERLWKRREGGSGEGRGKLFFQKSFPSLPPGARPCPSPPPLPSSGPRG